MLLKLIKTVFVIGMIVLLVTNCSTKNRNLLIEECCIDNFKLARVVEKNIYIGHFTFTDSLNKNNKFGEFKKQVKTDSMRYQDVNKSFYIHWVKQEVDELFRNEFYRRLKLNYKNVYLVDKIPSSFENNRDTFLEGTINRLWFTNGENFDFKVGGMEVKSKEYFRHSFNIEISTTINGVLLDDKITADYFNESDVHRRTSKGAIAVAIIGGRPTTFFMGENPGQEMDTESEINTRRTLDINSKMVLQMDYYLHQDGFPSEVQQWISAKIYNEEKKIIKKIDAKEEGSVMTNPPFIYYDGEVGGLSTTGHDIWFGIQPSILMKTNQIRTYKSKSEIADIKKRRAASNVKCRELNLHERRRAPYCIFNTNNTEYFDLFRQYTTNIGIIQLMINKHIDKIIKQISGKL